MTPDFVINSIQFIMILFLGIKYLKPFIWFLLIMIPSNLIFSVLPKNPFINYIFNIYSDINDLNNFLLIFKIFAFLRNRIRNLKNSTSENNIINIIDVTVFIFVTSIIHKIFFFINAIFDQDIVYSLIIDKSWIIINFIILIYQSVNVIFYNPTFVYN